MTKDNIVQILDIPVLLLGLGRSNLALLEGLKLLGCSWGQDYFCHDESPEKSALSEADPFKHRYKTIVVSPGFSLQKDIVKKLRAENPTALITNDIEIAFRFLATECIIAVTGSVGKSTQLSMVEAMLQASGQDVFTGGNIGIPIFNYINDLILKKRQRAKYLLLELSSYQLECLHDFQCDYSMFTFLNLNHLDRYKNYQDYIDTKMNLVKITKKKIYANSDSQELQQNLEKNSIDVPIEFSADNEKFLELKKQKKLIPHNAAYYQLSCALADELKLPSSFLKGLVGFQSLEHRIEKVIDHNGTAFYNDSKATTLDSVEVAVQAMCAMEYKNILLYIGGRDKNHSWAPWLDSLALSMPHLTVSAFGSVAKSLPSKTIIKDRFDTLNEALKSHSTEYQKYDCVLLSPGGDSLDEFKNFEDRGSFFKKFVSSLENR